jgi:hypothetical protein
MKETQTKLVFIPSAVLNSRIPVRKVHIFLQNGGCHKPHATTSYSSHIGSNQELISFCCISRGIPRTYLHSNLSRYPRHR